MKRSIITLALMLATIVTACESLEGDDYLPVPQAVDGGPPVRTVSEYGIGTDDAGRAVLTRPDGGTD